MYFTGTSDYAMTNEIKEIHAKAIALLPEIEGLTLCVNLNSRMRSCGGRARINRYARTSQIDMNYRLHKDNPEQLVNTYLHELAHVVANLRYNKNCGHDYLWKRVMAELGANDERCHTMDVSAYKNKTTRIAYACNCQEFQFTKQRHNKVLRGEARYSCKTCKETITEKVMPITAQDILSQST